MITPRAAMAAAFVLFFGVFLAVPAAAQTFVFHLSGDQEVPPVPSTHSGGCHGVLDQPAATFAITCVHDVINATTMHIHRANNTVAFDLGNPSISPVVATWTAMTPADMADLVAGNLYVNIHTAGRPAGEIRGQILPRTRDLVEFTASGEEVVPPNGSTATASCTADLNEAANALAIQCTHNVAGATNAHVHEAPFGINAPVVFTFPSAASPLNANMPLTPRLAADFAAAFLYLDIHTPEGSEEDPADEIRGQIGEPPAGAGTGTIVIEKTTAPGGGSGFTFTESITSGGFSLNDGGTRTFASVAPGTYTVTEAIAAGWSLADIRCDDLDSTGDANTRIATVRVNAGETVRCTFRNFETAPTDDLFVFHLSGDQEVPAVTTTERGGCMGRFDAGASELTLVCTHDVDLPTLIHVHRGAPGANGDMVFDMGQPTSPVIATWSGMTPANVADLLAGNLYINIHTSGRPAGAVRGQIVPRSVDTINFTAGASQVVPPGTSASSATCVADLSGDATGLAVDCTHNVDKPEAAHVHQAPRGENGPIAYNFPSAASPIDATMPMTPRLVADFAAHFLYLEIHGPDLGEETAPDVIRGQIAPPLVVPTTGTIRIRKATSPAGGTAFSFSETMTNGTFSLNDAGEQVFTNVTAGTYTVTEAVRSGWTLTDVSCSDGDSTGNPFARNATIQLQAGEAVTCTFTNLQSVNATTQFVFHLSGDQEVPPTSSTARGGCYGQLDQSTRTFSLVCTHNVVGPMLAHIHEAPAGANGPIALDTGDPNSPIEATWTLTNAQMAQLLAGNYYLNIHASGRPDGEIRGQILPRTVDRISFTASGAQEVPPTDSTATGNCLADLADDASAVLVQCSHSIPAPTMTHLHSAPPGVDGPVIFDFANTSPFSGNAPLTPRLVADFAAGFLYVNIHSTNYETGEIRGQVLGPAAPAHTASDIPTASEWALIAVAMALAGVGVWRMR